MSEFFARIESAGIARAASNAHAFLPARSMVESARVELWPDRIRFTATDGYAVGRDEWPMHDFAGAPWCEDGIIIEIDRAGLAAIDDIGRKDKKGVGRIEAKADDGLTFYAEDDELAPAACPQVLKKAPEGLWESLDEMLDTPQPDRVAFQPQLLQRFAKVKADKGDRVADLAMADPEAPVLFKIGPTFRGLVMPIMRERHAESVGPEGLW